MVLTLKVKRVELGLTQLHVGTASGISAGRYSLLERGLVEPADEERKRLSQILQAPAATLFRPACRVRPAHNPQVVCSPIGG
jgi:transcriptional regulator with XRE-family HTH domain